FEIRKQLLDYDDVANDQRRVIYQQRDEILQGDGLSNITQNMIEGVIGQVFDDYIPPKSIEDMWDVSGLVKVLNDEFKIHYDIEQKIKNNPKINEEEIRAEIIQSGLSSYQQKISEFAMMVRQQLLSYMQNMLSADKLNWNIEQLDAFCEQNGIGLSESCAEYAAKNPAINQEDMLNYLGQAVERAGVLQVLRFERGILLQHIDYHWRDHLTLLEQLRQGIHLRGYAQKDPKQEYKYEAFNLFSVLLDNIKRDVVKILLTIQLQGLNDIQAEEAMESQILKSTLPHHEMAQSILIANNNDKEEAGDSAKISRNSPCVCGSGKKYKHCCGKLG
ncbi:MAG: preprotein translocase subunit SecA, partial [Pseudomonadota bacterium]|nr:preprotein translocase subunit SecA [Pseudomonadota bacterium]